MSKLYKQLAQVYHEMYQSIFDYKKEFERYNLLLKKYKCKSVLEIGCGSGILASYFLKAGYEYVGLDFSNEMLRIAREQEPEATFIKGDMRNIKGKKKFDAVIITGKTISHLITNKDIVRTFQGVKNGLKNKGVLIFDTFDAQKLIALKKKKFVQTATFKNRIYKRVSEKTLNLATGWTENWNATYYITESGKTKSVRDKSVVRSFTKDELAVFLKLTNFDVLSIKEKDNVILTVARKK